MAASRSESLQELIDVVARLRDPDSGCPWDLAQSHASLVPYLLEEAHEVADAIRYGDDDQINEELGDLLLQVVLHARIASEEKRFNLDTVARGITEKLIRRHPHVFGGDLRSWEIAISQGSGVEASPRGAVRARGLTLPLP